MISFYTDFTNPFTCKRFVLKLRGYLFGILSPKKRIISSLKAQDTIKDSVFIKCLNVSNNLLTSTKKVCSLNSITC